MRRIEIGIPDFQPNELRTEAAFEYYGFDYVAAYAGVSTDILQDSDLDRIKCACSALSCNLSIYVIDHRKEIFDSGSTVDWFTLLVEENAKLILQGERS